MENKENPTIKKQLTIYKEYLNQTSKQLLSNNNNNNNIF